MMNAIEQAAEMGRSAFARGIKSAPVLDHDFNTFLFANAKQPGEALPLLEAWSQAWHAANLAAPVEDPIFGSVISSYTRHQAIEDGVLVDASIGIFEEVSRQHFKVPVAMSARLFEIIDKAVKNKRHCNDYKGVWHDVCWMSRAMSRNVDASTRIFRVIIKGAQRGYYFSLKAVCGPDDKGEPCITFMLADED